MCVHVCGVHCVWCAIVLPQESGARVRLMLCVEGGGEAHVSVETMLDKRCTGQTTCDSCHVTTPTHRTLSH